MRNKLWHEIEQWANIVTFSKTGVEIYFHLLEFLLAQHNNYDNLYRNGRRTSYFPRKLIAVRIKK